MDVHGSEQEKKKKKELFAVVQRVAELFDASLLLQDNDIISETLR